MKQKSVIIVGAGFGGLAAASLLAANGWKVTVLEKNSSPGGRARVWKEKGYTFDMGPSWYLMGEVFDRYFARFGKKTSDYYELVKLDPYYQVFFEKHHSVKVTPRFPDTVSLFDSFEPGGGKKLTEYLASAKYKYDIALKDFLYVDYRSIFQFVNRRMLTEGLKLRIHNSLGKFVARYFSDIRAQQILEYAMVFLGNSPANAPALYSIMSHVDLSLGVFYPLGGIGSVVDAFVKLGESLGVEFRYNEEAERIVTRNGRFEKVVTRNGEFPADSCLVNADYAHAETALLNDDGRSFNERYWNKRVVAPSMFIAYLGLNRKIDSLTHHNLYFAHDWNGHFDTIFKKPSWPDNPCYYLSVPSRTDDRVAPAGRENMFLLVPIAPGLPDTPEIREEYFDKTISHVEKTAGIRIRDAIEVKRIYSVNDFTEDYHALKGSALGIAHTIGQTAVFRPPHRSKKVKGIYYTGQFTHPGVGVPMTLISSEVVADEMIRDAEESL